ncbi:hypothetical protein AB4Z45_27805 [Paenibacillus sp. MCAF9]|uniref:hypothetical protein n=1 Tax=Paenibacillus sp. MCAF9 TaxID=3233046 RepID=UPI003F990AF3
MGQETSKKIAEKMKGNLKASPEKKKFIQQCIRQVRAGQNNLTFRQIESLLKKLSFEEIEMDKVISFEHPPTRATIFVPKKPLERHIEIVKQFLLDNEIIVKTELDNLISQTINSIK